MNNEVNISSFHEELKTPLGAREVGLRAIAELVADHAEVAYATLRKYGYAPKDTSRESIIAAISKHLDNKKFIAEILGGSQGWHNEGADPVTAVANAVSSIFAIGQGRQKINLAKEENKGVMLGFLAQRDATKSAAEVAAINAVAQKRIAEENRKYSAQDNKLILQIAVGFGFLVLLMGVAYFATRPPQTATP